MHLYFSGYVGRSCEGGLVVRGTNQTVTKVSKDNTFFHLYFLQMTISFLYPLNNIAIIIYCAKQACIFYEFSFWALLIINKNTLLLVMTTHHRAFAKNEIIELSSQLCNQLFHQIKMDISLQVSSFCFCLCFK